MIVRLLLLPVVVLGALAIGPLLLVTSRTRPGRFCGLMALLTYSGTVFTVLDDQHSVWVTPVIVALWLIDLGFLSRLPDSDLIRLGLAVVSRVDPQMTRATSRQLRRELTLLLNASDAERAGHGDRPCWRAAFFALVRGSRDQGNDFFYRPPLPIEEPLGLLIALHGSGGNYRLWLDVWKPFADQYRFAVVCPSFGFGDWENPAAVGVIGRCLNEARDRPGIDVGWVYLAGLSQGGCGVGRGGKSVAGRLRGLIFLSPTMEPAVLGSAEFVAGWRGRRVLVIQGGRDRNVRPAGVTKAVEAMRASGIDVTYHLDPGGDHSLFFARRAEVARIIGEWIRAHTHDLEESRRNG